MKLSIIIPCYNCEKYIIECIESVLPSLSMEDELICVDDGSSDHTPELLRSIPDRRVKILSQQNSGPGAARNAGIDAASGDLILFVDSDDIISPVLIDIVKSQPEDILTRQICMKMTRNQNSLQNQSPDIPVPEKCMAAKEVRLALLNADLPSAKWVYSNSYDISGPVVKTYSRKILTEYQIRFPDNLRWGEDTCFNLQYLNHISDVCFIPAVAYYYRKNADSLIRGYSEEKSLRIQSFLNYVFQHLDENDPQEYEQAQYLAVKQYLYILQYDICSRYNTGSFASRRRAAWKLIEDNRIIRESFKNCSSLPMNAAVRIAVFLVRIRCFGCLDMLLKCYTKLR